MGPKLSVGPCRSHGWQKQGILRSISKGKLTAWVTAEGQRVKERTGWGGMGCWGTQCFLMGLPVESSVGGTNVVSAGLLLCHLLPVGAVSENNTRPSSWRLEEQESDVFPARVEGRAGLCSLWRCEARTCSRLLSSTVSTTPGDSAICAASSNGIPFRS